MEATLDTARPAPATRWISRALSGLPALFLALDGLMKLVQPLEVIEGSARLGIDRHTLPIIGIIELACVALHVLPRTAVLGAVLLTGFLGGAIAIHLRIDDPLLSHTLFPIYVAALLWGGLYLRDARVRALGRALFAPGRSPR